jgi:DNA polymerase-3 subunit delta'
MSDETILRFEEIVGQERAIALLQRALESGRLAHAYLFAGPEGVGKATSALAFARAANCDGGGAATPDGGLFGGSDEPPPEPAGLPTEACGECPSCRKIEHGNHPDVRIVSKALRAEEKGKRVRDLTIEQVRPLLSELAYRPYEGRRRVILLDGAHDLNASAQNALLKSLEEPPPDTTFILVTHRPGSLLPTVVSRSRIIRFGPVPAEASAPLLARKLGLEVPEARALAAAVGGSLGRALGERSHLYERSSREGTVRAVLDAASGGGTRLLDTAEEWSKQSEELPARLDIAAGFFRDAGVQRSAENPTLVHPDLRSLSAEMDGNPDRCFRAVRNASVEIATAAQDTRLVLEHMLAEIRTALGPGAHVY